MQKDFKLKQAATKTKDTNISLKIRFTDSNLKIQRKHITRCTDKNTETEAKRLKWRKQRLNLTHCENHS